MICRDHMLSQLVRIDAQCDGAHMYMPLIMHMLERVFKLFKGGVNVMPPKIGISIRRALGLPGCAWLYRKVSIYVGNHTSKPSNRPSKASLPSSRGWSPHLRQDRGSVPSSALHALFCNLSFQVIQSSAPPRAFSEISKARPSRPTET